jgi:hypothetical protein
MRMTMALIVVEAIVARTAIASFGLDFSRYLKIRSMLGNHREMLCKAIVGRRIFTGSFRAFTPRSPETPAGRSMSPCVSPPQPPRSHC